MGSQGVPPGAAPPDWYGDPTGRHQHRYWDGARWTHHVADNGKASVDELDVAPDLAIRLQELLRSKDVNGLRQLARSEGNAVTDVLTHALDNDPDPQVKLMAIDSLGLTSDPRAARVLAEVVKHASGTYRETAALSLANVVANGVKSPEAIPSLTSIVRDESLNAQIRAQAVRALCLFRGDDAEVKEFLDKLQADPNEDMGIRMAAADVRV
jgi:HEAT repeat protein